jgi:hypothetical protein
MVTFSFAFTFYLVVCGIKADQEDDNQIPPLALEQYP